MKILITGGCGFLGSNLASSFIRNNDNIFIIDAFFREGSRNNLEWLKEQASPSQITFLKADLANFDDITSFFKTNAPFDYVCHVAGQVAMTTSLKDPRRDFESNVLGTFNILEAVRKYSPDALVAFSSTNKVYGDLEYLDLVETNTRFILNDYENGISEDTPLDFSTPYGCSKGAADQYVKDWARVYGLKTIVFRHSSIYGGRQFASFDQGWIGWFCQKALEQQIAIKNKKKITPFTISGTGKQVRDVLHADDLINLYKCAYKKKETLNGEIFNIGGGIKNSLSILELFDFLEEELNLNELKYKRIKRRSSDQDYFIADITKAKKLLNWSPNIHYSYGIKMMLDWCRNIKI